MKQWAVLAYLVGDHKGEGDPLDAAIASELKAICDAADFQQVSLAVQIDFQRRGKTVRVTLIDPPVRQASAAEESPRDNPLARIVVDAVEGRTPRTAAANASGVSVKPTSRRRPPPTFAGRLLRDIGNGLRNLVANVMNRPDENAADKDVLQDFVRFGKEACPAQHYLVYFFGHAFGPIGLFLDARSTTQPPSTLRLNDLADALAHDGGRADVVLFRDCFMSTLEAAYQLQPCADFLIASQAEAPIAGVWPWRQFMNALTGQPDPRSASQMVARQLTTFLSVADNRSPFADVPYALLDVSATPRLTGALGALVNELEGLRGADPARRRACVDVLEAARIGLPDSHALPGDPALIDVATVCDGLRALGAGPLADRAKDLSDVLQDLVPFTFSVLGRHKGVALFYTPLTRKDRAKSFLISTNPVEAMRDAKYYGKLALCMDTGWARFAMHPLSPSQPIWRALYSAVFKR